jgi:hypothetical protein
MSGTGFKVSTWNVAAINNNPFEYWMTHEDPKYDKLMNDVEQMMADSDSSKDVPIVEFSRMKCFQNFRITWRLKSGMVLTK